MLPERLDDYILNCNYTHNNVAWIHVVITLLEELHFLFAQHSTLDQVDEKLTTLTVFSFCLVWLGFMAYQLW